MALRAENEQAGHKLGDCCVHSEQESNALEKELRTLADMEFQIFDYQSDCRPWEWTRISGR